MFLSSDDHRVLALDGALGAAQVVHGVAVLASFLFSLLLYLVMKDEG